MFRLGAASVASKSEPRFENRVINDCESLKVELAPTNGGIVTYEWSRATRGSRPATSRSAERSQGRRRRRGSVGMPRHTVAVLVAAVMSTAAVAAHASVSSLPGRNGEILFAVDWPTHLQFGGTDPKGVLVEICGLEPGRAGRRWTIGSPGMLALDAAPAPAGTPVAVTVVGTGAYLALVSPGHLSPVRLRGGGSASWSPDAGSLAFTASPSPAARQSAEIFVLDLATGVARQLTAGPGYAIQPRWSPDGAQIAFTSTRTGSNQVYTMAANGSDERQLTAPPGESGDPDWSPDGGRIVFASDRSGSERLYTMQADGSGVAPVGRGIEGTSPVWSPDGREFAFAQNEHLHVVAVDGSRDRLAYPGPIQGGPSDWAPRPTTPLPAGPSCIRWAGPRGGRIVGTRFADVVLGGGGADRISTGAGEDQVIGSAGADTISGGPGVDWIEGDEGGDRLDGGSGADHLYGGAGNDAITARDGTRDTIDCGPGRDTVIADKVDVVAKDCERVLRVPARR